MSDNACAIDPCGGVFNEESGGELFGLHPMSAVMSSDESIHRKRVRDYSDLDNDDFIEVNRKSKRLIKKQSKRNAVNDNQATNNSSIHSQSSDIIYEVTLTSKDQLPKQIAFAKLLRDLNIKNIVRIKFKSNYKVSIAFGDKENADFLIQCEELIKRDWRCYRTDELKFCYGIVRQIDLDTSIEELQKIFVCESEIASLRRLRRQNSEGIWVDSETIRICFKSTAIPPYVSAYGCRFIVEPYTFPVSQCANCWRFSHLKKFCPHKKSVCPKCGLNHENCDTKFFKCVNCGGPHMAIERSKCPEFKKEKELRCIMSAENCSYKKALMLYTEKMKTESLGSQNTIVENTSISIPNDMGVDRNVGTYSGAVLNQNKKHIDKGYTNDQFLNKESENISVKEGQEVRKKVKNKPKKNRDDREVTVDQEISECNGEDDEPREKHNFSFIRLLNRLRDIILSRKMLSEKFTDVLSVMFEECYPLVADLFRRGEFFSNLLSIFGHG
ncbi:uncharacterized protein LOC123691915 [Colias croceus]|uniref:uncharacterized protein LOC123691915 n=1 Tax=Colias crocea TaxID=72248 RepID=UPI001E27F319|nr:uncharacterized protein LOC123691915 [Colias croceus]